MSVAFVAIGPTTGSGSGDPLEVNVEAILALVQAMPTTIDTALENYRSNGVASTNDMTVCMADAEQASNLADATLTAVGLLPSAADIDTELTTQHGSGAWTDSGIGGDITGDYALSISVIDDTTSDPIENAHVRIYRSGADGAAPTDVNGEVVMGRSAATWTVIISAAGYETLTTSLIVTADDTLSYELSPLAITPSTGDFTTGYLTAYDEDGIIEVGAIIYCELHKAPVGDTGFSYDSKVKTIVSSSVGLVEIPGLVKGGTYRIWRGTRNSSPTANNLFLIPTTAGATYELPSHIGRE